MIETAHDVFRGVRMHPLEGFFTAMNVAIIGATETENSVGRALVENLRSFRGKVYPVHPHRKSIFGRVVYPRMGDIGSPIDLAVIATPASSVPSIIQECVTARVPAAVIISAGFKEIGEKGAALESEILKIARTGNLRIIGPNCLGIMRPHMGLNATFAADLARPGKVAFISQSGALCTAILDWSLKENVGFSAFVSVGSMMDVGWGDLIDYFGDDPHTQSIVCYMESISDVRSFLSAAREVALTKPVVVIKVGRTEAAAKAAASHTGSLTGRDEVLDAAFRRVGVLRVDTIEELFHMAEVLAKQPRPQGPNLSIVTNAGGPGALSTDRLVESGGQLAEVSDDTLEALNRFLPAHWSHGNPIDILGDADPSRYVQAVQAALKDPKSHGTLVILTPQHMTQSLEIAKQLAALPQGSQKPILASWMGGPRIETGEACLNQAGIPTFRYPDAAAKAFAMMWSYTRNLDSLYQTPVSKRENFRVDRDRADRILQQARKQKRTLLTEVESKRLLACYGIPTVETLVARSEAQAVQHAKKLGFPVVVKLLSRTLTHKTDVGGVVLDIRDVSGVRRAWKGILSSVTQKAGRKHFSGVTVQPMISRDAYELIVGSSFDPQFGPVILFGSGGQLVEVYKDRALGLPPLNSTLARRLIEQTRIYAALQGVRGRAPVDFDQLENVLIQLSYLVLEQPWISEIDVNPLLASSDRMVALDARVVLHPPQTPASTLRLSAIRPYPTEYELQWKLQNGQKVWIRPIRPEDESLMVRFHETLSESTVYQRYFAEIPLNRRIAHRRLSRICFIDYDREMALVVTRTLPDKQEEILGVGRLSKLHGVNEAEFALVVADAWQDQGLGSLLLERLLVIAKKEKLTRIKASILLSNDRMLRVCRRLGFRIEEIPDSLQCRAVRDL